MELLILLLIPVAILYLFFSLIIGNFDIYQWDFITRVMCFGSGFIIGIALIILVNMVGGRGGNR